MKEYSNLFSDEMLTPSLIWTGSLITAADRTARSIESPRVDSSSERQYKSRDDDDKDDHKVEHRQH